MTMTEINFGDFLSLELLENNQSGAQYGATFEFFYLI